MTQNHKVVFFNFEKWGEEGKQYVAQSPALRDAGVEVAIVSGTLAATHIPADTDFDIAAIFMDSTADAATIAALPNLKFLTAEIAEFAEF